MNGDQYKWLIMQMGWVVTYTEDFWYVVLCCTLLESNEKSRYLYCLKKTLVQKILPIIFNTLYLQGNTILFN